MKLRRGAAGDTLEKNPYAGVLKDAALTAFLIAAGTIFSIMLHQSEIQAGGTMTTLLFMVCILITSTAAAHPLFCGGVQCFYSVLLINFLHTEPYLSFEIANSESWVRLAVMFLISCTCGTMTARIRSQERAAAHKAYRTGILLDMSQSLQRAGSTVEILHNSAEHIIKLLRRSVVFVPSAATGAFAPALFELDSDTGAVMCHTLRECVDSTGGQEQKPEPDGGGPEAEHEFSPDAGSGSELRLDDALPGSKARKIMIEAKLKQIGVWLHEGFVCVTLGHIDKDLGVIVILPNGTAARLDNFDKDLLTAMAEQCALALEKAQSEKLKQQMQIKAERERLRADLLRSISHDLRTPLTGIVGNACVLLDDEILLDEQRKHKMYNDIQEDALWLLQLVENLLSITRIENDSMSIKKNLEVLADVLDEAYNRCKRYGPKHTIILEHSNEMILVKMEPSLIMQVISNLVDNAVKYTPKDASIVISYEMRGNMVCVMVADNGGGVRDEDKELLFETFVTLNRKVSDGRRSVGLGLSLCRTIVQAHGGSVWVEDNTPQGAIFCFTLPVDEVL